MNNTQIELVKSNENFPALIKENDEVVHLLPPLLPPPTFSDQSDLYNHMF